MKFKREQKTYNCHGWQQLNSRRQTSPQFDICSILLTDRCALWLHRLTNRITPSKECHKTSEILSETIAVSLFPRPTILAVLAGSQLHISCLQAHDCSLLLHSSLYSSFKENDNTLKFIKHVSTETSVIFSWLIYKALEVEFKSRKKMLITLVTTECTWNGTMWIKRIILDLRDVIADSKKDVLFEYEMPLLS